jgi:hypothetical protein
MSDAPNKNSGFGIGEVGNVPASTPLDDLEAERLQPAPKVKRMVKCACGHTVPASLVMSASLGTSCPDCYDRMSD